MSSACTGVYTAEVCMALIEKTVRCSACGLFMNFTYERCHDPLSWNHLVFLFTQQKKTCDIIRLDGKKVSLTTLLLC